MDGISHGTTDQAAMDSSTKTIFMRCMKALNISFFLGCSWICTNQNNKSLFSNSFIIFLMPTWIEIWFKGELGEEQIIGLYERSRT